MNSERPLDEHDDECRRRSGTSTSSPNSLRLLENRAYKTYGARREFAKRLQVRGDYWNTALVFLTSATVLGSLILLLDRHALGPHGEALMVVVGVVALVASLMVAGRDYRGRSREVFSVYRGIQRLSTDIESAVQDPKRSSDGSTYDEFDKKYQDLLDGSENHAQADYFRAHHPILRGSRQAQEVDWKREHDVVAFPQFAVRWTSMIVTILATALPLLLAVGAIGIALMVILWATGV